MPSILILIISVGNEYSLDSMNANYTNVIRKALNRAAKIKLLFNIYTLYFDINAYPMYTDISVNLHTVFASYQCTPLVS